MPALDVLFKQRQLLPVADSDLLQNSPDGRQATDEGMIGWEADAFGKLRLYTYRQQKRGVANARGDLLSNIRDATSLAAQTGTVTTSATGAGGMGTNNSRVGALAIVTSHAGNAAPQGEVTIVQKHTDSIATFEPSLPLSAPLALGDSVVLASPKLVASASGDSAIVVAGVSMNICNDSEWGWYQFQGYHPKVAHSGAVVNAGSAVKAGTAVVQAFGDAVAVTGANFGSILGFQMEAHNSSNLGDKSGVMLVLFPTYF